MTCCKKVLILIFDISDVYSTAVKLATVWAYVRHWPQSMGNWRDDGAVTDRNSLRHTCTLTVHSAFGLWYTHSITKLLKWKLRLEIMFPNWYQCCNILKYFFLHVHMYTFYSTGVHSLVSMGHLRLTLRYEQGVKLSASPWSGLGCSELRDTRDAETILSSALNIMNSNYQSS